MEMVLQDNHSFFSSAKNIFHFIAKGILIAFLVFFLFLFVVLSIYGIDLFINSASGKERAPLFGLYIIMSGSMEPNIHIKDGIIVKRMEDSQYKVGDVITFYPDDDYYRGTSITHRIIDQERVEGKLVFHTKGDNNSKADSFVVLSNEIRGKVILILPKIGYVHDFFSRPTNYFICLLTTAILYIGYQMGHIFILMLKKEE